MTNFTDFGPIVEALLENYVLPAGSDRAVASLLDGGYLRRNVVGRLVVQPSALQFVDEESLTAYGRENAAVARQR